MASVFRGFLGVSVMAGLLAISAAPALAGNGNGNNGNGKGNGGSFGAPGPLAAAGLPFMAIGYGAYLLYRRRR